MDKSQEKVNLFYVYMKKENEETHAFMSFLNYLNETNPKLLTKFLNKLGLKKSNRKIEILIQKGFTNKEKKSVLSKKIKEQGCYDGSITIDNKTFYLLEFKINSTAFKKDASQVKKYLSHLKDLDAFKNENKYLVFVSSFDAKFLKDNIQKKLTPSENKKIKFISWNKIYSELGQIDSNEKYLKQIILQYKKYLEIINFNNSGIIQKITKDKEIFPKGWWGKFISKSKKWYLPKRRGKFDVPNFTVFLYQSQKFVKEYEKGIFAYFESDGLIKNPLRDDGDFQYYYRIKDNKVNIFKEAISSKDVISLLNKTNEKNGLEKRFDSLTTSPSPYFLLNRINVDELKDSIESNPE